MLKTSFQFSRILLKRIFLVYILFGLSRIIFLLFNGSQLNGSMFQIIQSLAAGLIFDTSAICYLFGPFILLHLLPWSFRGAPWYQSLLRGYFVIITFISLLLNLIDTGYYPFNGRRSGIELFSLTGDMGDQAGAYLYSYWYLAVILLLMVYGAYRWYPKSQFVKTNFTLRSLAVDTLQLLVAAALGVIGARGGVGLKPIANFDAARFADVRLMALTLNTPFQMLVTSQFNDIQEKEFMPQQEAVELINPYFNKPDSISQKPNVVLIIMESMGKEYIGAYNDWKGYTPFLDSLMKQSTVFDHAFANGKRSIEGIPAIIASMPSIMPSDYINTRYQTNTLHGIGDYLKQLGYQSSFYHGCRNGTMGFDNFVAVSGSGNYFGLDEYPDKESDFDGHWGIFDEPYLKYTVKEMNSKKGLFFSTIFTLSAHHPYSIPDHLKGKFPKGTLPIHTSIGYADFALRSFFTEAAKQPWYKHTIFIITADHSAENETPYYQSMQGKYQIPLMVFNPSHPVGEHIGATMQQADILPMVMQMVGKGKYFALSNYGKQPDGFAIQHSGGLYQLIQWPWVYHFDGNRGVALYNAQTDGVLAHNLIDDASVKSIILKMDQFVKAYIQQYNHALISNQTQVD